MMRTGFLTDVEALRERARRHMRAAAAAGDGAGRTALIKVLNEALATEIVCMLRYKRHQYAARGVHGRAVVAGFAQHAAEEQSHADLIAGRIVELGGAPDYSPASFALRRHSEYDASGDLVDMMEEDLVAERVAIESYGEIIRYLGDDDPATRHVLESILEKEEEHADDLSSLLHCLGRLPSPSAASLGAA